VKDVELRLVSKNCDFCAWNAHITSPCLKSRLGASQRSLDCSLYSYVVLGPCLFETSFLRKSRGVHQSGQMKEIRGGLNSCLCSECYLRSKYLVIIKKKIGGVVLRSRFLTHSGNQTYPSRTTVYKVLPKLFFFKKSPSTEWELNDRFLCHLKVRRAIVKLFLLWALFWRSVLDLLWTSAPVFHSEKLFDFDALCTK